MFGRSPFGPVRWALAGAPLLCLFLLSGCTDDGYPDDLKYEVRPDPVIVVPVGKALPPAHLDPPGEHNLLAQFIEDFKKQNPGFSERITISRKDLEGKDFSGALSGINRTLRGLFGTPANPRVNGLEAAVAQSLRVGDDTLERGSRLYRRHCLHCHGLTGNGQGPTGAWVNPHPRDYRLGQFKFISTAAKERPDRIKPRRADLLRTLTQGIEGTSMPSFALQPEEDLNDLVSYVIHLSLRGQVEVETMTNLLVTQSLTPDSSVEDHMVSGLQDVANLWVEADKSVAKPDKEGIKPGDKDYAASVKRGHERFKDVCIKCHFEYGRRANLSWDNWGTVVRPANLTLGVYRGGRRPIDLYWRIHVGIPGSNMPAFGYDPESKTGLTADQIWDVINFLQVLPYPAERERFGIHLDKESATAGGH